MSSTFRALARAQLDEILHLAESRGLAPHKAIQLRFAREIGLQVADRALVAPDDAGPHRLRRLALRVAGSSSRSIISFARLCTRGAAHRSPMRAAGPRRPESAPDGVQPAMRAQEALRRRRSSRSIERRPSESTLRLCRTRTSQGEAGSKRADRGLETQSQAGGHRPSPESP